VWIWEEPASSSLIAAWIHVGDTRLYHHGSAGWNRVTKDHAKGRLLDRAVGQGPGLVADTGKLTLHPDDRLVLVSDGVWKHAPPASVLTAESFPTAADSVRRMVGNARLNGSRDDTSAITIAVRPIDAEPEPEH